MHGSEFTDSVFANSVFAVTLYKGKPRVTTLDSQWIQNLFLRSRRIKHVLAPFSPHLFISVHMSQHLFYVQIAPSLEDTNPVSKYSHSEGLG